MTWKADLVVLNSNVITMNPKGQRAEAFAVKNGRFIAVGGSKEVRELIGTETRVLDLHDKTVLPGFIDAHCHPSSVAKGRLKLDLGPKNVTSIEDVIRLLSEEAKRTPKGKWILGTYFDDTKVKENRMPWKEELDKASRDHPIAVSHVSLHIHSVNSKAFELAGITDESPDPEGGELERRPDGKLNGVVKENAFPYYFTRGTLTHPPVIPPMERMKLVKSLSVVLAEFTSRGITSVGDALVGPEDIRAYQDCRSIGGLKVRVNLYVGGGYLNLLSRLMIRMA